MKKYTIDDEWDGARIDRLVHALAPGAPYGAIQTMLRKGKVTLNAKKVPGCTRLAAGDIVEIRVGLARACDAGVPGGELGRSGDGIEAHGGLGRSPGTLEAPRGVTRAEDRRTVRPPAERNAEIAVLYEDDDVLVIDKPGGLVVQPGNRAALGSLLDLLSAYQAISKRPVARGENLPPFPYTPVHRLDRETSGALVVAKTRRAARELSRAFASGNVEKRYLALVEGIPSPPHGTIDLPLRVTKGRRSTAKAAAGGKRAETHYALSRTAGGNRSLLEVRITTGRTHQIRAHLAGIGHPVVGDRRYGVKASSAEDNGSEGHRGKDRPIERQKRYHRHGAEGRMERRQCLHAWKISFPHPRGLGAVEVTAPPPPWARDKT